MSELFDTYTDDIGSSKIAPKHHNSRHFAHDGIHHFNDLVYKLRAAIPESLALVSSPPKIRPEDNLANILDSRLVYTDATTLRSAKTKHLRSLLSLSALPQTPHHITTPETGSKKQWASFENPRFITVHEPS
ncbi:hypothetical protein BGX28_009791, partial [Mortierella sp. GBA30]